jgi:sugar diacid utilization regulator
MHTERTASELTVHPNTLRYRIARFEELTGADLREPACALEVWWALQDATDYCGHSKGAGHGGSAATRALQ